MHHELKIMTAYFHRVLDGSKPFEIRYNDRNFQEGDTVTLNEWDGEHYTSRSAKRRITVVTDYAQKPGFVVFGMKPVHETDEDSLKRPYTVYFMAGWRETKTGGQEFSWMTKAYPDSVSAPEVMDDMRGSLIPSRSDYPVVVTAFNEVKSYPAMQEDAT